jgi:hypothetical protein
LQRGVHQVMVGGACKQDARSFGNRGPAKISENPYQMRKLENQHDDKTR